MTTSREVVAWVLVSACSALLDPVAFAQANPLPDVKHVVSNVNTRNRGSSMFQVVAMTLTDASGNARERQMSVYWRNRGDEEQSAMFFTKPASVEGTALLVRDYTDRDRGDGLWLYLPAMRNVRRISSGGRGEEFFGSDFTLLEVSTDTRLRDDLLAFEVLGREPAGGSDCVHLSAIPLSDELVKEVGYGRAEYWVDEALWIPRRVMFWNTGGAVLKEIRFEDVRQVGDVWTVHRRVAENLVTRHRSDFVTTVVRYGVALPDTLFSEAGLSRGPLRDSGADTP